MRLRPPTGTPGGIVKIAHKLLIVPAAAMAGLVFLGGVSYFAMQDDERRMQGLKDVTFSALQQASQQSIALGQVHAATYARIAIAGSLTETELKQYGEQANSSLGTISKALDQLRALPGAAAAAQALPLVDQYRASVAQALDLASMDPNTGVAAMQGADGHHQKLRALLAKVVANLGHETDQALQEGKDANRQANWITLLTTLVGFAALAALTSWVTRTVLRPIAATCAAAERLAAGDLATDIVVQSDDELGALARALSTVVENWRRLLGDIRNVSSTITQKARGRHHWRDRRNRLPDQYPGAQRDSGSGARRRAGTRLCGGGHRGAGAGATPGAGGTRNQGPDRGLDGQCGQWQRAGQHRWPDHGQHRFLGPPCHRDHERDHRGQPAPDQRHRGSQQRDHRDG